jgi:hypothetical protein
MKSVVPLLAILAAPFIGHAADVNWKGTTSDSWEVASNWDPATVPTASDVAIFGLLGAAVPSVDLHLPAYTLQGIDFQAGGYSIVDAVPDATPVITLTNGTLSSTGGDFTTNLIAATVRLTSATNTITVTGGDGHELDTDDVEVTGSLTTHVETSLCLGGATTISGAFVKTGEGETCAGGGISAASSAIDDGTLTIEFDSSLGNVTVSSAGTMVVLYGANATANSVESHGVVAVSPLYEDAGVITVTNGLRIKSEGGLTGGGTIVGDVTVESDGSVAPGNFFGDAMKVNGNLTLELNSTTLVTIVGTNLLMGSFQVTGNLSLNGWLSLNGSDQPGLYTIAQYTGTLTGAYAGVQDADPGYNYDFIYGPNAVQLSVTAIPEPSTIGLVLLAGGVGVLVARRRK